MLVTTDRGSASTAEAAAWLLRTGLDARLIGGNTAGMVAFGNLSPYLLPQSGLLIQLATASSSRADTEMTGLPVDLDYDVHAPIAQLAEDFDTIFDAASPTN